MSQSMALAERTRLPVHRRALPLLAVGAGRLLARCKPARLRRVLEYARRGARPAEAAETGAAREQVVAVSLRCAGRNCLQRSLATTLLCRLRGT